MEAIDVEKQPEPTITMKMRGRPVSHEEARKSAQRLINSHFRNPDSARCQIPVSYADDDVTVVDYIHEQSARASVDKLAHSMAFEFAESMLDGEGVAMRDGENERWWMVDPEGEVDLFDSLRYLEARGLLERHAEHADWVRVRDESEATR